MPLELSGRRQCSALVRADDEYVRKPGVGFYRERVRLAIKQQPAGLYFHP